MVELFFLFSGFTLSLSCSKKVYDNLKDYFLPKLQRILPIYLITMITATILQFFSKFVTGEFVLGLKNYSVTDVILSFLGLQCGIFWTRVPFNVPAWFITPLLFCYFSYYYLCRLPIDKKPIIIASYVIISGIVLLNQYDLPILNARMARGYFSFFMGVVLYYTYNSIKQFPSKKIRLTKAILVLFILVIVLLVNCNLTRNLYIEGTILFFIIVLYLQLSENIIKIFQIGFISKLSTFLSKYSLSIFLVHYFILTAISIASKFFDISRFYDTWLFFLFYSGIVFTISFILSKRFS